MRDGFIKIAAATPDLHVADCAYNTSEIVKLAKEAAAKGAKLITFPELCLTGYTCGDLFLQETLLEGALDALNTVCRETAELAAVIVVGLPLRVRGKLYNVAAVVNAGDVLAFVPKTHLPNYSEFYEQRHFVSADTLSGGMESVDIKNADGETVCVPLVTDTIFQCDEQPLFTFGVEICEDLWVPNPPSTALAQMGAHIIVNLSASDEIIGKAGYRRDLVRQQSGRLLCAYLYADAGFGESTQDLVFAGHDLIAENGALLAESKMFSQGIIYADIDLQRLAHERQRMNTFASIEGGVFSFSLEPVENDLADRTLGELSDVLQDVLDTPVSPELLPPKDGEISQKTEDLVGPYELHDFFLYYMLRFGYPPRKIFRAAHKTFAGVYDDATIKKWLTTFMRRFFTQQFKRSCLPDGPKVGTVTLSPRGDWRMPSDAVSALWLKEAESL